MRPLDGETRLAARQNVEFRPDGRDFGLQAAKSRGFGGLFRPSLGELSRKDRDEKGRSSSSFGDTLTYFAGWSPSSKMPRLYLNDSIRDSLNKLMREKRRSDL